MDQCTITIISGIFELVKFMNNILDFNDNNILTPAIEENIKRLNKLGVDLIFINNNYYITNINLQKYNENIDIYSIKQNKSLTSI